MTHIKPTYRFWKSLLLKTWKSAEKDRISYFAAALSFYAVFSIPAVYYVIVTIGSLFSQGATVGNQIVSYLTSYLGTDAAVFFEEVAARMTPNIFGNPVVVLISVIVLLYAATNLFTHLQGTLEYIYAVKDVSSGEVIPEVLRQRGRSLLLICATTVVLFLLVLVDLGLSVFAKFAHLVFGPMSSVYTVTFINLAVSFFIVGILFAVLYHALSYFRIDWGRSFHGGFFASFLFMIMNAVLSAYFSLSGEPLVYGIAGSVIVTLLWVYCSAYIFLLGAELSKHFVVKD